MEPVMVPPQNEGGLEILPLKTPQYHNNNVVPDRTLRLTIKPYDQLYSKEEQNNLFNEITMKYLRERSNEMEQNGVKVDVAFARAKEMVLACGILPQELEIKESGVFAKRHIEKGTRYGPFQGKWAGQPQDQRFAWEVNVSFVSNNLLLAMTSWKVNRHRLCVCTKALVQLWQQFHTPVGTQRPPCSNNAYFAQILPILTLKNVSEPVSSVTQPIYTLFSLSCNQKTRSTFAVCLSQVSGWLTPRKYVWKRGFSLNKLNKEGGST